MWRAEVPLEAIAEAQRIRLGTAKSRAHTLQKEGKITPHLRGRRILARQGGSPVPAPPAPRVPPVPPAPPAPQVAPAPPASPAMTFVAVPEVQEILSVLKDLQARVVSLEQARVSTRTPRGPRAPRACTSRDSAVDRQAFKSLDRTHQSRRLRAPAESLRTCGAMAPGEGP